MPTFLVLFLALTTSAGDLKDKPSACSRELAANSDAVQQIDRIRNVVRAALPTDKISAYRSESEPAHLDPGYPTSKWQFDVEYRGDRVIFYYWSPSFDQMSSERFVAGVAWIEGQFWKKENFEYSEHVGLVDRARFTNVKPEQKLDEYLKTVAVSVDAMRCALTQEAARLSAQESKGAAAAAAAALEKLK